MYHGAGGYYRPGIMICDVIEITIGGELYMALKRLRFADSKRVLWVDAVCINQDDLEERRLHVQFMGQIYTQAKKVLVWLGNCFQSYHPACSQHSNPFRRDTWT